MMKMSKYVAGMSAAALAVSAAVLTPAAYNKELSGYVTGINETWKLTYSGADIAALAGEAIVDPDQYGSWVYDKEAAKLIGYTEKNENGESTGKVPYYTFGFRLDTPDFDHAKLTVKVTSSTNNIYDGESGVGSSYMYTFQERLYSYSPSDDETGDTKVAFDMYNGYPVMTKDVYDLVDFDAKSGSWASISLTDDNVDALTFEVTITSDENTTWHYHPYDSEKTDDNNAYGLFIAAFGAVKPISATNSAYSVTRYRNDGDEYIMTAVPLDFINSRIGGQTSSDNEDNIYIPYEELVKGDYVAGVNESWTLTYSGADIAALAGEAVIDPKEGELDGKKAQLVGYTPKDKYGDPTDEKPPYYTLVFNIQVGQIRRAKVTIKVTSSTNNIYDGKGGTDSGYMYAVTKSWAADAPTDDVAGWKKYDYNEDGSKVMAKGACDLVNWSSGRTKYNGQWASISLTDDNVSALTFEVTVTSDDSTKWEYQPYDPEVTEDENVYPLFFMASGAVEPISATNSAYSVTGYYSEGDKYIMTAVPLDFINSRIKEQTSSTPDTSSAPDSSSDNKPDDSSAPDSSSTPDDSSVPDSSSTPDDSSAPDSSSTPDDSSAPDSSSTPDDSSVPDDSSTPDDTGEPDTNSTPGDLNNDGETNVKDVIRMQKSINDGIADLSFDVNGDNEVNIKDVIRLQKYLNGDPVEIF